MDPTPPPGATPAPRALPRLLAREAPWILGVAVGLVLLLVLADAFRPSPTPTGADWWEYRLCAHILRHPEFTHYYPPWRPTLYPWLLGGLGEPLGYPLVTGVLASGSVLLLVLGAALGARALAGPWAGAVAAVAAALLPMHTAGAHWTNPYPLLGALCALGVAAAVAACRWPRWPWVAAAGLIAGLGWAADNRGVVLVPLAVALVVLGPRGGLRATWRRRALLLALVLITMAPGKLLERAVAVKAAAGMFDNAAAAVDPGKVVPPMHVDGPPPGGEHPPPPSPEAQGSALDRVLAVGSLPDAADRVQGHMTRLRSLPPAWLIWLPLLALLPGRRGWRASLAALGVLVFTLLQVIIPAWLTDFGARYAYFFLGPVVMLAAAAPSRLASTLLGDRRAWVQPAAAMLALGLVLAAWGPRPEPDFLSFDEDRAIRELDGYLRDRLGPDDTLMECAVLGAETHWYPRRLHPGDLNPYGADWRMCQAWVSAPDQPGERRWLVSVDKLTHATPEAPGLPFSSSIPDPATQGWRELHRFQLDPGVPAVIVWRRPDGEQPR
jgi:hypothetical protein